MMRVRSSALLLPLCAALLLACKDEATSTTPPAASSAVAPAASPAVIASAPPSASASAAPSASAPSFGAERQAGVAGMFVRTARQLPLSDEQMKSLDKILEPVVADDSIKNAMRQVHDDTIAGLKVGKMDMAKLSADYGAFDKAAEARRDKEAAALNDLHKLLDANQRKALTAKMRDRQKEREDRMAARKAKVGDAGAPDWSKRRFDQLTRELALDADQQKKVEPLVAKEQPAPTAMDARMADGKKRMDALLAAFEKDDFDAKKIDFAMMTAKDIHADMERRGQFYAALVPLLKPEQRERLVAALDKPVIDRPHMGDQENE